MYQISASALARPASGHFWQIRPNPAVANFFAGFPDLLHFGMCGEQHVTVYS